RARACSISASPGAEPPRSDTAGCAGMDPCPFSMSAQPGAVWVAANVEDLLQYLSYRAQWIELTAPHLVEEPPQLGVVGDGMLEVRLRTRRRDGEDLAGQVARAPFLESAGVDEMGPVRFE